MSINGRRGYQRPKMLPSGINHFALIKYFEEAKRMCDKYEERRMSVAMENMIDFFRNYDVSKPLKFDSRHIGF